MAVYEFICKAPNGKEVRGECKARNPNELAATLAQTGLKLHWWQEKKQEDYKVVTKAFAKEMAGILKTLSEPRYYDYKRTFRDQLNFILVILILIGSGAALYVYLDSRISMLEKLNFQPNIVRQMHNRDADPNLNIN